MPLRWTALVVWVAIPVVALLIPHLAGRLVWTVAVASLPLFIVLVGYLVKLVGVAVEQRDSEAAPVTTATRPSRSIVPCSPAGTRSRQHAGWNRGASAKQRDRVSRALDEGSVGRNDVAVLQCGTGDSAGKDRACPVAT